MSRAAVAAGWVLVAVGLLAARPAGAPSLGEAGVVVEGRGVVAPGLEVALGTPVERLPAGVSLAAYDPQARAGLVQWWPSPQAPVLLVVSGGRVRAISVAYVPGFRTSRGVELGDPEEALRRAYRGELRDGSPLASHVVGRGQGLTYFDTSCSGRVNAIAVAEGLEGLRALAGLWAPAAGACGEGIS